MRVLLIVAGLLNVAFVAFHVVLGLQFAHWSGVAEPVRGLLETFNAGSALVLAFLAYACLVRGKEVMGTGLGAATLALGTFVYGSRAAAEFLWLNGSLKIFAVCIVMALVHLVLFLGVRVTRYIA